MARREEEPLLVQAGNYLGDKAYQAATASTNAGRRAINTLGSGINQFGQDVTRPFMARESHANLFNTQQSQAKQSARPALNNSPQSLPGADRLNQLQSQLSQLQADYKNIPSLGGGSGQQTAGTQPFISQSELAQAAKAKQNMDAYNYAISLRENGGNGGVADPNPFNPIQTNQANTREVNPVGSNAGLSPDRINEIRLGVQSGEQRRERDFNDRYERDAKLQLLHGDTASRILHGPGSGRARNDNLVQSRDNQARQGAQNYLQLGQNALREQGVNERAKMQEQGVQGRFDILQDNTALQRQQEQEKYDLFKAAQDNPELMKVYKERYGEQPENLGYGVLQSTDAVGNINETTYNKNTGETNNNIRQSKAMEYRNRFLQDNPDDIEKANQLYFDFLDRVGN